MEVGSPTVDQLRIFLAVAEQGSFNQAARKLGRALSVISYGIAALELHLGVKLFDREGSRRPKLTDPGRALLADARSVIDEVDGLMARARSVRQGLETELSLAVDVMVPSTTVAAILRDFQVIFPSVDLRLHVEALGAVAALVLDRRADLAVAGPDILDLPELQRRSVGSVSLIPVASPAHPLAQLQEIAPGEAKRHLQLVLTDRSSLTEGKEFSVISPRTWRLADLGAKHALLLEGIGWGNMPLHVVAEEISQGRLVKLELPENPPVAYLLHALWRRDTRPGPATSWMQEALADRLPT
ncbi:LysR family transcriptional regulator [Croceibacterium sp. LX-88]|uniref:LysR family transcriptional regulator n=1 Tax=Croceibacterium selenioxidans TaxID=2838833 RepID=A0ABS5W1Y2_9SPHN|nr:LysR family transcriptional regulator [Croceibacterium selenioxidans]MBT2133654.1 LysR family transcriptional regulator [Croceibacterium selenioxidans]